MNGSWLLNCCKNGNQKNISKPKKGRFSIAILCGMSHQRALLRSYQADNNSSRPAVFQPKCIIVTSVLCSDLGDSQSGEYTPMK